MPDLAVSWVSRLTVLASPMHPPGAWSPGVPTAHRPLVNATMRIEAKVRRYTGTRCISPAPEMVRTDRKGRTLPGLAGAELAKNGSILLPLDYRRGSKSKADVAELAGR
nr:hypothetical protein [Agrobacterium rosae]